MFGHAVSHGGLPVFNFGLPWPVAVIVAGLFTVPFGLAVAVPAIRLSGTFLALATLGFGILLQQSGFGFAVFFGAGGSIGTPRPHGADGPWAFYYVVLATVGVCAAFVAVIERARLGRLLRALGDSPVALSTLGTSVTVVRAIAFAFSAFLAGVSGALIGGVGERSNSTSFQTLASLALVAVLSIAGALGGGGLIVPAFIAGIIFTFLPSYATQSDPNAAYTFQMLFGIAAVVVALLSNGRWSAIFARRYAQVAERGERSPVSERLRDTAPRAPQPSNA
jgi:ABC-type branched-subunit amino acid transport system permease subunit